MLLSVPVIGTHLVFWIFGGAPPGHQIIGRDYWVHILVLPALAGALLLVSFRPSLRWPRRVRPAPLLLFTCVVLVLLGTITQVNPVWLVGLYQPGSISSGAASGWYMGFLDGALRIMPAWDVPVAGHPLALGVLVPGLVVPGLFFTCWLPTRPELGHPSAQPVGAGDGVVGLAEVVGEGSVAVVVCRPAWISMGWYRRAVGEHDREARLNGVAGWPRSPAPSVRWATARGGSRPGSRCRSAADLVPVRREVSQPGGAHCHA